MMRDNETLQRKLETIWQTNFSDIEKKNNVIIRFKGKWKNKFGHIKLLKDKSSEIAINAYFKDETIPDFIIDLTVAHELTHYAHGFNSPHPKLYKYPHQGGIVYRELKKRGFSEHLKIERKWLKEVWKPFIQKEFKTGLFRFF